MRRFTIVLAMLLCGLLAMGQAEWTPEKSSRLVNDYSGVLTAEQRNTLEQRLVFIIKALQVAIDAGVAVGMSHIDCIAEAIHVDSQTAHKAVSNGIDEFTLLVFRLDIESTMKMERTGLTEIASKDNIIINGRTVFYILNANKL